MPAVPIEALTAGNSLPYMFENDMPDPSPSLSVAIESLKAAYAALNRNDIPGFLAVFDPQVERFEPPGFPEGQRFLGIDAFTEHTKRARGTWAEGTCEPQRFVAAGEKVVVSCHVHVRLNGRTDWIDGDVTDVFTFRNGKAVQFISFISEAAAMEFAGV
ncbi:MAG TPA: nuclear transport factor 2 family protein [Planctomycetaceae bacterium]|nr:nuclear transport factor 2 family protein [Planctomycetaceae bacterium]